MSHAQPDLAYLHDRLQTSGIFGHYVIIIPKQNIPDS